MAFNKYKLKNAVIIFFNILSLFLNILEKYKNPVLKMILNTSLKELYEAYINSDEFKVDEINRLKKKNMNDWYINRYIFLSKNFLKCSEQ